MERVFGAMPSSVTLLDVSYADSIAPGPEHHSTAAHCQKFTLSKLLLSDRTGISVLLSLPPLPELKRLSVGSTSCTIAEMTKALQKAPNVEQLYISTPHLGDEALNAVASTMPRLKVIFFQEQDGNDITVEGIRAVWQGCETVLEINLFDGESVVARAQSILREHY